MKVDVVRHYSRPNDPDGDQRAAHRQSRRHHMQGEITPHGLGEDNLDHIPDTDDRHHADDNHFESAQVVFFEHQDQTDDCSGEQRAIE